MRLGKLFAVQLVLMACVSLVACSDSKSSTKDGASKPQASGGMGEKVKLQGSEQVFGPSLPAMVQDVLRIATKHQGGLPVQGERRGD